MTYDHVVYEKRGHVAYVTLNRPERMNALDAKSHAELIEVFDDFAADDGAWVAIVTGAGDRAFCAGNDLKATADASARGERRVDPGARFGAITRGYRCPKPLIAAVNGVAAGGGFEIALACDIVVAADSARFGLPEPRVGLIAGAGGIHRLARQIPLKQAMGMLLTGRLVPAAEGVRLGFQCVQPKMVSFQLRSQVAFKLACQIIPYTCIPGIREIIRRDDAIHQSTQRIPVECC